MQARKTAVNALMHEEYGTKQSKLMSLPYVIHMTASCHTNNLCRAGVWMSYSIWRMNASLDTDDYKVAKTHRMP